MMRLKLRRETSVVEKKLKTFGNYIISIQRNKRLCSQHFQPSLPNPAEGRKERLGNPGNHTPPCLSCAPSSKNQLGILEGWTSPSLHGMKAKWNCPLVATTDLACKRSASSNGKVLPLWRQTGTFIPFGRRSVHLLGHIDHTILLAWCPQDIQGLRPHEM